MEECMNKKELSVALAKRSGLSQAKALDVVNALFNAEDGIIAGELYSGNKVTIPGFGTFLKKVRKGRTGTHPGTGAKIQIPATPYAHFKAGRNLRENITK